MASVRARNGKLVVDFQYMGQRCREQTVLDDTPANHRKLMHAMTKIEAEITLGIFEYGTYFPKSKKAKQFSNIRQKVEAAKSGTPLFEDFAKTWFYERQIEWRDSYQRKIQTMLDKYLMPFFALKNIEQITKPDLLEFRASLAKVKHGTHQKSLAASRINQIMTPLRMILEEAADRYGFETPYRGIKNLKEKRTEIVPFDLDEIYRFLATVRPDFKNYYTVRFFTGLRTSEIDGLRWRNVDLERQEIYIKEALVDGKLGDTKTADSNRTVKMSSQVYEALQKQHVVTAGWADYVFCDNVGKPFDYRNVNRRIWHPTLKLLQIKPRSAYQTRHTAASLWLASGENPEWIAKQLGHSNTEMLFRVYSNYVPDLLRKDGTAFEALIQQSALELKESDE